MRSQRQFRKPLLKRKAKDRRSSGHEAIVAFQHILLWTSVYVLASEIYMLASGAVTSELLASSILLLTSLCCNGLPRLPHDSLVHVSPTTDIARQRSLDYKVMAGKAQSSCGGHPLDGSVRSQYCVYDSKTTALHTREWSNTQLSHTRRKALRSPTHRRRRQSPSDASRRRPFCTFTQDLGAFSCQPIWCHGRLRRTSTLAVLRTINRQSNVFRNVIQVPVLFFSLFDRFNLDANLLDKSLAAKLSGKGCHRLGNILCQKFAPIIPYPPSVSVLHTNAHVNWIEKTLLAAFATPSLLSGCITLQGRTVRMVPPSPALLSPNPVALKRSEESLSSMYSRSVSGESRRASAMRPALLRQNGRTYSSSSTTTVVKSPLGTMRLARDYKEVVSTGQQPSTNVTSRDGKVDDGEGDSDIDDAATLQARLPPSKSHALSRQRDSYCERPRERDADGMERRLTFTPLNVKKTRDSAVMFSARHV
ncbi:hypothetical protein D0869_01391 [Hortaea werneckii]|uniref:Uncharacterized protein n=1 Tax=Hortaea werneckii TaxID=91943 RepID=A0A3M6XDH3_HORWE|nr:hypothetical protein D0869_01391 [Hortaea werneckii]RMY14763.1 hypothetical protein D0868_01282 [Hortaea werneckii]